MTIAEVSKKYELSADTLRYYERIGLVPPVPRNKSGIRDYDTESCQWVELMKCMRSAGVQIEALIEYVALFQQGDETIGARKALLIEQRDQLVERMAEMQRSLDRLNDKIERYDQADDQGASAPSSPVAAVPARLNLELDKMQEDIPMKHEIIHTIFERGGENTAFASILWDRAI